MANERQILERLAWNGRVLAVDLARQFGISEDTARRDLRELAAAGRCRRVYGGALPLSPAGGTILQRESEQTVRKAALGHAAADLIARAMQPHEVLFLMPGRPTSRSHALLPPDLHITVVTNTSAIAAAPASLAGIEAGGGTGRGHAGDHHHQREAGNLRAVRHRDASGRPAMTSPSSGRTAGPAI